MVIRLFSIINHVQIKFGQNHYQINLFQNYFVGSPNQLIHLKGRQNNSDLHFAKMDPLTILFFYS